MVREAEYGGAVRDLKHRSGDQVGRWGTIRDTSF
jgi:hypothetical protein